MADHKIPTTELLSPDELRRDTKNPNQMTDSQLTALAQSIQKFGFIVPIVTNKDLKVADGHQRLKAAEQLGLEKVPVIQLDVEEVDRTMLQQILNKLKGEHDGSLDADRLEYLQDEGALQEMADLLAVQEKELLKAINEARKDPDDVDEDADTDDIDTDIEEGQVYKLGRHLLMCGDATNPDHVLQLFSDGKADSIVTDPPYGVSYTGSTTKDAKEWDAIENDDLRDSDLRNLIADTMTAAHGVTKNHATAHVFYASKNHREFENGLEAAEWEVKQQIIWAKTQMVLSRSDYHWAHEPILYAKKLGESSEWWGDRKEQTVVEELSEAEIAELTRDELISHVLELRDTATVIKEGRDPGIEYQHPTQKPVKLLRRFIRNTTPRKGVVYDPFAGSGSTLIACELEHRSARVMDLEPKYCQVVINRWEAITGETAERIV